MQTIANNQDPQFEMIREYRVWGVEKGHSCYCPFDTYEEAENVRIKGHPDLPHWKPYSRKGVRFALVVLRRMTDPNSRTGTTIDQVGSIDDIDSCDEIRRVDRHLRRLADAPPANRCSDRRTPRNSDPEADAVFSEAPRSNAAT
jgi:hypothetical protein